MNTKTKERMICALFFVFFVAFLIGLASLPLRYSYNSGNTESVLLAIPRGEHFDLLFMGSSRTKTISRYGNHEVVEGILGKRIFNLGKGGGHGAVLPEQLFLKKFYEKGNSADEVFYFVDPFIFFSHEKNESGYVLEDEPLDISIWGQVLVHSPQKVWWEYFLSKLDHHWFLLKPEVLPEPAGTRGAPADQVVENEIFYSEGMNRSTFLYFQNMFEKTIALLKSHNTRIVLIIPPMQLHEAGKTQVLAYLHALAQRELESSGLSIEIRDYSLAISDPKAYIDSNHLNKKGVELLARMLK